MATIPVNATNPMRAFMSVFAAFSEVVKDGLRYGTSPGLEGEFVELRQWLLANYRFVRAELRSHYRQKEQTTATDWPSPTDSLERLLTAPTLSALIACPDRLTNARLTDTHDAIQACLYGRARTL